MVKIRVSFGDVEECDDDLVVLPGLHHGEGGQHGVQEFEERRYNKASLNLH